MTRWSYYHRHRKYERKLNRATRMVAACQDVGMNLHYGMIPTMRTLIKWERKRLLAETGVEHYVRLLHRPKMIVVRHQYQQEAILAILRDKAANFSLEMIRDGAGKTRPLAMVEVSPRFQEFVDRINQFQSISRFTRGPVPARSHHYTDLYDYEGVIVDSFAALKARYLDGPYSMGCTILKPKDEDNESQVDGT